MSSIFTTFGKHVIKICTHVINGSTHVPKVYSDVPLNIFILFSTLSRFKSQQVQRTFNYSCTKFQTVDHILI